MAYERVKEVLRERGISHSQFARQMSKSRRQVLYGFAGQRRWSRDLELRVAEFLNLPPSEVKP